MQLAQVLKELSIVDRWLDENTGQQYKDQPLAQDWARISKIAEELGEATDDFILYTAQNPRKEPTDSIHDTLSELADVWVCAGLAVQHFTKDEGVTGAILLASLRKVMQRTVQEKVVFGRDDAKGVPYLRERPHDTYPGATQR